LIPPPPAPTDAGAEFDFETYSEAGFVWRPDVRKWGPLPGAPQNKKGLPVVNAAAYTEHPTAEVLTLSYRIRVVWWNVRLQRWEQPTPGKVRWRPGQPPPQELFDYVASGGTLEAFNVMFERLVWANVCVAKYGWPSLEPFAAQLRCAMAKARVNSLPGALGSLSDVLRLPTPKDKDGKRLLDKFSIPRNPTKADPRLRVMPDEDPADFEKLQAYCDTDLDAEHGASTHPRMSPMSEAELTFWLVDQEINWRGVGVDRAAIRDCIVILNAALRQYGDECRAITGGLDPTQLQAIQGWLRAHGVHLDSMDEEALDKALGPAGPIMPPQCRRVLEIRQLIGSASVKKLFAMENQATRDDRLRNLIVHHGARTGRPTGEGPQPLNLPREGPSLYWCSSCAKPFGVHHAYCPHCATPAAMGKPPRKWSAEAVDFVLAEMACRSLELIEWYYGDALGCISGCLRGLFVAAPGHELIASDFSSIEAVVTAMLSGCQWRIDAFRDNKPIYLLSAGKITGRSLEFYLEHKAQTGDDHPDRQKIGKVAELANGFGGWIGSSRAFGSEEPDDVIKAQILAWREASPEIPEMWGGQWRGKPWDGHPELYGFEGCAIQAIQYPGQVFSYAGIRFHLRTFADGGTALIVTLLSGRELTYHNPTLAPSTRPHSRPGELQIWYMTWNTNPKYGPMGWVPMQTYGGRLTENIVQAVAHDILRHSILALRAAGYPCVLHVYDEIVCEIPEGTGSLEEFERIMGTMPPWAADWPIRAAGGWRGRRYRKG